MSKIKNIVSTDKCFPNLNLLVVCHRDEITNLEYSKSLCDTYSSRLWIVDVGQLSLTFTWQCL